MHAGSILGETKAGHLYAILKGRIGEWFGAYHLSMEAETTCLSTRISEVRRQLPPGERIEVERRPSDMGPRWYYRLVRDEA